LTKSKLFLFLFAVLASIDIWFCKGPASTNLPHIFIISADALRADHLSCYGYPRPTSPNIDRFAKDSILFENAISQAAGTLGSTSSLFTSLYPSVHKTNFDNEKLSARIPTLPEIARTHGYNTGGFVQNEFLSPAHGLSRGFLCYRYDNFDAGTFRRLTAMFNWLGTIHNSPAFVFFHILNPHSPYNPPEQFARIFNARKSLLASSNQKLIEVNEKRIQLSPADRAQLISLYDAEIRYLDSAFGKFIERLKQLGMYDNSIIAFLSDHGEAFQEHGRLLHGSQLYEPMIHIPLIIKLPARYKRANVRIRENVQTIDVMPTVLEVAKLSIPKPIQGKSLLSLMTGDEKGSRNVFSENLSWGLLCIKKNQFKYIHSDYAKEELFDLNADPQESRDLSAERADLIQTFREERNRFLKEQRKYGVARGERIQLDENQTEELKALGYVQ
jgi:arylsulfatase A-like enzyme